MESRFEKFTALITNIGRCIQKIKSMEMKELGLKGKQVLCIFHLSNSVDGLSSTQLFKICEEDKAAISRTIKELESLQLVFVQDGEKKYRNPIKLTQKGRKVAQQIQEKINQIFAEVGTGLQDEERKSMYCTLELIHANLKKFVKKKEKNND